MSNRLLVVTPNSEEYVKLIQAQTLPQLDIRGVDSTDRAIPEIQHATIILGNPGMVAPLLHKASCLRWVQSTFAGVDRLCRPGLRRDYLLTGVKETFGPLMSEYVFGYILALERRLFEMRQLQREHCWRPLPYQGLGGKVLGICGLGSIGRHIAQTGRAFSMRVVGYRRTPEDCPSVERTYTGDELGEFLSLTDYLVLALPATPGTRHLIDSHALDRMKKTAVIINVGRGGTLVESDLAQALAERRLGGAVLDVFEQEPLPEESPLWGLSACFVTPHVSAVSFPADIVRLFCSNYRRFLSGQELEHAVDFEQGY